ncbi:MAG: STAS domain-containing protein [Methylococcaceae bacterium]|nr:STAS domain-containing protein [Methylococcaceae bacterium]
MAKILEKEAVGFDPLAWMNDDQVDQQKPSINSDNSESEVKRKQEIINEKETTNESESTKEPGVHVVGEIQAEIEKETIEEAVDMANINTDIEIVEPVDTIEQDVEIESESKIILDTTLNIQTVGTLYDQFLKKLDTQQVIEIDASSVESIDTASLQMITVFKQEGIKLQKEISIDFPSDKFIEAAEILGLAELLEVDQAAAGFF